MGFFDNLKNFDKKQAFVVLLIFLLAFGLRADLMKFGLFFEFDSYYHARMTSYVIQNGFAPAKDVFSYYQLNGGAPLPAIGNFFWQVNALIYKIFTLGAPYSKDLFIWFVKILPAFYGAITAVLMFFLGKEVYGRKAGYVMGFMAAVVPAFVYRTMAGFYEPTSWGFMWFALGAVFLAKALRNPMDFNLKTVACAVLGGMAFGLMSFAYSAYLLVPLIWGLYLVFAGLIIFAKNDLKQFFNFAKLNLIAFAVFIVLSYFSSGLNWIIANLNWLSNIAPLNVLLFFAGGIVLIGGFLLYVLFAASKNAETGNETKKTIRLIATISLYATLIVMLGFFLMVPAIFQSGFFGRSVGEENLGNKFFANKYNALIILPAIALLLVPFRLLRNKTSPGAEDEPHSNFSIFLFFWIFVTLFMAWYKLKFTFQFGLPVAIGAAIVVSELFNFFETRAKNEKYFFAGLFAFGTFLGTATNDIKVAFSETLLVCGIFVFYFVLNKRESWQKLLVASFIGFMLLVGIAAGTFFVKTNVPSIEADMGWKEAIAWIKDSTPKDAKLFNWWNQGHWLSFLTERAVFIDNRNLDFNGSSNFSKFIIAQDLNEGLEIIGMFKPDYVVLSYDMFFSERSFAIYAFETDNPNDARLGGYLGAALQCNSRNSAEIVSFDCGGNILNQQQMDSLYTVWNNIPNQFQGGRVPIFVYKNRGNSVIYLVNDKVNNSMLGKLWFNQPETMKYFEEVYSNPAIKIFRVK